MIQFNYKEKRKKSNFNWISSLFSLCLLSPSFSSNTLSFWFLKDEEKQRRRKKRNEKLEGRYSSFFHPQLLHPSFLSSLLFRINLKNKVSYFLILYFSFFSISPSIFFSLSLSLSLGSCWRKTR